MQHATTFPRLALASILVLLSTSCASVLTTWHDQAYTTLVPMESELVETVDQSAPLEQVADLAASADELYGQGYVLVGYTKFSHTLAPSFQAMYAKMYADHIGAARVVQSEPQVEDGVYAYTVTYWARGRSFPFGAYYNDVPEETAMLFPDSLRESLGRSGRAVVIEAVVEGSPAEAAGLRAGELIAGVDGEAFDGVDGLDALIPLCANREITLAVFGLDGMREVRCTLRERLVSDAGYGTEGLYYNQPWAFDGYRNFHKFGQAFTQAWNDSWDAYEESQQQAYHDAQYAAMNAEIGALQSRIDGLERMPSERGSRAGLDIDALRQAGAKNWERFSRSFD